MKVKVIEEFRDYELERSVNEFLSTISEEQIKYIKMSGNGEGYTTVVIFYTEK